MMPSNVPINCKSSRVPSSNHEFDFTCEKDEICANSSLANVQCMLVHFKMHYLSKWE